MANGEQFKFARHLDQDYGPGTAQEIETESNQTRKWSIPELQELVDNYTSMENKRILMVNFILVTLNDYVSTHYTEIIRLNRWPQAMPKI